MKRFVAVLVALSLCLSLLSFSALAAGASTDDTLIQLKWRSGTSSSLSAWRYDSLTEGIVRDTKYQNFRLREFTISRIDPSPFIIVFRLYGYNSSSSYDSDPLGALTIPDVTTQNPSISLEYQTTGPIESSYIRYRSSGPVVSDTHYTTNSVWFYIKVTPNSNSATTNLTFTLNSDLNIESTLGHYMWLSVDNISLFTSQSKYWEGIQSVIETGFSDIDADFSTIIGLMQNLYNAQLSFYNHFYSNTFTSWQLNYDSDGVGHSFTIPRNFFDSTTQTLTSIGTYLGHLVDMENRSMSAGAGDLLDSLDMESDFGSLSDFGSIGSIGTWSGSNVGSAGEEGLLEWFSADNAAALDQVANRGLPSDDFVSFYSDHISEILDWGE